jgi:hypothetical protein
LVLPKKVIESSHGLKIIASIIAFLIATTKAPFLAAGGKFCRLLQFPGAAKLKTGSYQNQKRRKEERQNDYTVSALRNQKDQQRGIA